jgi:hypothetical protein
MRVARLVLSFTLIASFSPQLSSQQTASPSVQRDAQALAVLAQVMNAAGGVAALSAIHDFTGSGTIVYNWANQDVHGAVVVRGRGTTQFRLDASLPDGVRTWIVNDQSGSIRETNGHTHEIPFHNAMNFGSLSFPYAALVAVLNDPSATIRYLGSATNNGRSVHQIRVQPISLDIEPSGLLHKLSTKDYFIDANTFQILSTLDMVHPDRDFYDEYPHEVTFSDYRRVNGIPVPFSVEERVAGQHAWTMQLSSVNLNPGLSDQDFQL